MRKRPINAFDPTGVSLQRVCRSAVDDLGLTGAAVVVMSGASAEAVASCSDEASRRVEEIQFDVGEGPGREAFDAGRPVLVPDLEAEASRWPAFARAALRAGIGAVFAFPLQLGASRFGVLTLSMDRSRVLGPDELNACLTLAEAAAETLLDGGADSLSFRSEVYQAQGMVMVDLGIGLADALARMRGHAFATGTDLEDLALDIIAGRTRLELDEAPP